MALTVPAISSGRQSALLLILAVAFLGGLAMAFWSYWGDMHPVAFVPRTGEFPDQAKAVTGGSPNDQGSQVVMKRLTAMAGVGMVVMCAAFAAAARPGASVERSLAMDAVRDDVRTAGAGDTAAKNASPRVSHGVRSRRRPHTTALPRGKSERNIQLRQQQQKSD
ncbi:hypothetical protein [Bradyrhizobium liaoningense]|uniref:hypothetical protein n=1 Tax=Bradyrhizobium liaoningense TaxID=43992 RepID=UPI001BA4578F|nr:hypothetical protein [Bradyrhizobium liaoningense]MBR0819854.1 hypothetical protein [Bradyrhizobium liaoningense]